MHFIDLQKQYSIIKPSIKSRIDTVLNHGQFVMGPEVYELEAALAKRTNTRFCISCSNGTDALVLALMAYNIGPGDAIFTTSFSFFATAEAIAFVGAMPVFVDVDPITGNIDPMHLEKTLKKEFRNSQGIPCTPKGIIAVDIFGVAADYDAISAIAQKNNLFVMEDAAQSFGGSYHSRPCCSLADVATTSFYPAKPLGGYGEGGAVFTNNEKLYNTIVSLRIHGMGDNQYDNIRIGMNARLETLQAAIILAKLESFDNECALRQSIALTYSKELGSCAGIPDVPKNCISAWALYTIRVKCRDELREFLKSKEIPVMIYYPTPLHLQKAFSYLGYAPGDLPISERLCREVLSIPFGPYLDEKSQQAVIANIVSFMSAQKK
jgi:UDP-2-acetamido-2-deoxy-ribo-hexuluronate aminotransferase